MVKPIGEGSFGKVYLARKTGSNECLSKQYAIKLVKLSLLDKVGGAEGEYSPLK